VETRSILLVEDNPDDQALTARALQKGNLADRLVVVFDGFDALDYLFATGDHAGRDPRQLPALVLLDLNLPRTDGFGVLRRIRADERTRLLPIVILTSSAEEQDIVKSYRLGANSFVRKPVDPDEFDETVRQLGLYWTGLNQPPPTETSV
jgi:two-component system response regulator